MSNRPHETGTVHNSIDPRPGPLDARSSGYPTTAHGPRLLDTDHSSKAGTRGPSLPEDSQLRENITHFDHERIPERVVHARCAAAHVTLIAQEMVCL